jgi:hypothetical protein
MSYSVIYSNEFDSFLPLMTVKLQIEKKDYTGAPIEIVLSGNPIIQEWQEDDPKAPIRGCTLKVNIITDSTGLSLQDFYSDEDNTFKAIVKRGQTDEILFVGYLLQDDCAELYIDFNHEISLTFTDNLGILKDITIDVAAEIYTLPTDYFGVEMFSYTDVFYGNRIWVKLPEGNFNISTFVISNSTYLNGTYTVTLVSIENGFIVFTVIETVPISTSQTGDFFCDKPVDLVNYFSLSQILRLCLRSTNLDLHTNVMSTLCPDGGTTNELVLDTFLEITTFKNSNDWMNCYHILEQILSRFNASLFQAHGAWYIVRFDEMYNYLTLSGATWSGFGYDYDFNTSGVTKNIVPFTFLSGNDIESGVIKSIVRPYQYVKETFNYKKLPLLQNQNLSELGNLLNQYIDGSNTIKEYEAPYWIENPLYINSLTFFIRIVYDTTSLYELERYLVLKNTGIVDFEGIYQDILVDEGDLINFSFQLRYNNHTTPPSGVTTLYYLGQLKINDGINTYWFNQSINQFSNSNSFYGINIFHGDYADTWHNLNYSNIVLPKSGILRIWLPIGLIFGSSNEAHFNNFNFSITNIIAASGAIVGHTHEDYQLNNLKNNIDKEIFIDNTNKYTIYGSLFLSSFYGILRNKANIWKYPSTPLGFTFSNLGNGMTQEALFTNYFAKTKFEGNYLNLINAENVLTPFAVFIPANDPYHSRYVPGKMTIDYKNGSCNLTLYQWIYFPTIIGGTDPDLNPSGFDYFYIFCNSKFYEFNYLYEKS